MFYLALHGGADDKSLCWKGQSPKQDSQRTSNKVEFNLDIYSMAKALSLEGRETYGPGITCSVCFVCGNIYTVLRDCDYCI